MAIAAAAVYEVRTAGSDTNGGGFVTGAAGTDYSQQNSKNTAGTDISTTDAVAVGSTTITSLTANFGTSIVGNIIYFAGGTGTITGTWRQVTARASSTSITIDASIAASTGMTMNIGGALATPGQAAAIKTASNSVWIKAGTYTLTTSTPNVSGGPVSDTVGGSTTLETIWTGYQTTRGDYGTKPVISAGAITSITIMNIGTSCITFDNIAVDGNLQTSVKGISSAQNYSRITRCKASNCTNTGIESSAANDNIATFCETTGCTTSTYAFTCGSAAYGCTSHDNTNHGFQYNAAGPLSRCIAYRNTGSSDGFNAGGSVGGMLINCVAAYNGQAGIDCTGNVSLGGTYINCIVYGNTDEGFRTDGVKSGVTLFACAGGANSANYNATNIVRVFGFVSLSADPFTNVSSSGGGAADFTLNNTAGGGAACKAVGYPLTLP